MRIGLNLLFLIPKEVGGTETYTRGLLKALAQVDPRNEYVVFINRESRQLDFIYQLNYSVVECGVNAKNRVARLLWEQFVLPFQARQQKLDILHSLGYVSPLILPCKSVVTIHDLNYRFVPQSMTMLTRIVQWFLVTLTAYWADHIIVVSEFVREQVIVYLKLQPEKVTTIHEAVEQNSFVPVKSDVTLLGRYGINMPYIFAFSGLTPHKNIAGLVRAFARIKQNIFGAAQLVIVGHQPRGRNSLVELIESLGLNFEDVILTGYVDGTTRRALLSNATVFVFPSFYEGFGLPILEAMASGVAVACSSRGSLPEIAGDAALYFDPSDIDQMANVLMELLNDGEKRLTLITRGEKTLQRFSWESTARKTLEIYKNIVG